MTILAKAYLEGAESALEKMALSPELLERASRKALEADKWGNLVQSVKFSRAAKAARVPRDKKIKPGPAPLKTLEGSAPLKTLEGSAETKAPTLEKKPKPFETPEEQVSTRDEPWAGRIAAGLGALGVGGVGAALYDEHRKKKQARETAP